MSVVPASEPASHATSQSAVPGNRLLPLHLMEGFFGRSWPWETRAAMAPFLARAGFQSYIYAPKDDPYLRRQWDQPWPRAQRAQLEALVDQCHQSGLRFGIGLSPFEIYRDYGAGEQAQLARKIDELNSLGADLLCLLFDDMRGDMPNLAQIQIAVAHSVAEQTGADRMVMCPTYYSTDPILEQVFGRRPPDYWSTLARDLDRSIDLFWTGPQVCSTHYDAAHLDMVGELLGRKPFLWDNYPVNDGAATSRFLHLRAFTGRAPVLDGACGHAVNPMNQAWLSRIALSTLRDSYLKPDYDATSAFEQAAIAICGPQMGPALIDDLAALQDIGLDGLDDAHRSAMRERYRPFLTDVAAAPCARELLDWLDEQYAFDPACLTG